MYAEWFPDVESEGGAFSILIHASRVNLSEENERSLFPEGMVIKEDDPSSSRVVEYVELWE
mgnify:CR=1 FL=1